MIYWLKDERMLYYYQCIRSRANASSAIRKLDIKITMPVAIGWQTYADYVALINAHPARIHPEEKYQDRFSLSMV